jgi:pre-mRNA-processing factor 40
LVDSGKIKARSKWKEVYPAFRDDERYLSMLGNPGSNPLELFWDTVDSLDQQLDEKIAIVEGAIARHNAKLGIDEDKREDGTAQGDQKGESEARGFFVRAETSEEEFKNIVKANADDAVSTLTSGDLRVIYRAVRRSRFRIVLGG